MFLKQIRVKQFAESKKINDGRYGGRKMYNYPNKNPDDIFYVVGVTAVKDGATEYDSEAGYYFVQKNSHKVYVVAKSIGRKFKVLPEDIEIVGEEGE